MADILHETAGEDFQIIAGTASMLMPSLQLGIYMYYCFTF